MCGEYVGVEKRISGQLMWKNTGINLLMKVLT